MPSILSGYTALHYTAEYLTLQLSQLVELYKTKTCFVELFCTFHLVIRLSPGEKSSVSTPAKYGNTPHNKYDDCNIFLNNRYLSFNSQVMREFTLVAFCTLPLFEERTHH